VVPELPDAVEMEGAVITIDAMGTQHKIVDKILERNAGYVLAVKENPPKLHDTVQKYFEKIDLSAGSVSRVVEEEVSRSHVEHREYDQVTIPKDLTEATKWNGLKTISMVRRPTAKPMKRKRVTTFLRNAETAKSLLNMFASIEKSKTVDTVFWRGRIVRTRVGFVSGRLRTTFHGFTVSQSRSRNKIHAKEVS
jgi:predicted transposase YbfD/YdcC